MEAPAPDGVLRRTTAEGRRAHHAIPVACRVYALMVSAFSDRHKAAQNRPHDFNRPGACSMPLIWSRVY